MVKVEKDIDILGINVEKEVAGNKDRRREVVIMPKNLNDLYWTKKQNA